MPRTPLMRRTLSRDVCLQLQDHSVQSFPAAEFFKADGRDPAVPAARLAGQFVHQNRTLFERLQIKARHEYDGKAVQLVLESGATAGAVPLLSPMTGRFDFGLVVQPRFPWPGIGPMLARMGWRIAPTPLRLPMLRRTERKVPAWVISVMVLTRLDALLKQLDRRFEHVRALTHAPKGSVDWSAYATGSLPSARFLEVPCRFPDLRDDRSLKGAIRFTLEAQIRSLSSQREHGAFVHQLIEKADSMLQNVRSVPPLRPQEGQMQAWLRTPLRSEAYIEGLQAIDWTMDERGLAGLSDLEGIPWLMPMDAFFEAWVEVVMQRVSTRVGGELRVGRLQQTVAAVHWEPPYTGSQRSLRPDLVLNGRDFTLIVDAKYKRHFEELSSSRWNHLDDWLREGHRADLLQALAYGSLSEAPLTICVLAYPCRQETWESLKRRGMVIHQATLPTRSRRLLLWLTAVPMHDAVEDLAQPIAEELRRHLREAA